MKLKKLKRWLTSLVPCMVYLLTVLSVNSTCTGPSFQPKLPDSAEKYKRVSK